MVLQTGKCKIDPHLDLTGQNLNEGQWRLYGDGSYCIKPYRAVAFKTFDEDIEGSESLSILW